VVFLPEAHPEQSVPQASAAHGPAGAPVIDNVAVYCRRLCLGYGGVRVLDKIDLDIPEGAFLPFVGPNGGGKTTLLRSILGFVKPEHGEIGFGRPEIKLGYVPQQKSIDPLFPVSLRQIVTMGLYRELGYWQRPDKTHRALVSAQLEEMGLGEHGHKNYRELSGGMKQKALIARALVSGADVLILDEPTSELDTPSERDIIRQLLRLCREQGKTVLIACHGIQMALTVADRVCLVERSQAQIVPTAVACQFTAANLHADMPPAEPWVRGADHA